MSKYTTVVLLEVARQTIQVEMNKERCLGSLFYEE